MIKKLYAVLMSLFITAALLPQNIYAEEEPAEETAEEISETEEIEEEEIPEETVEVEEPAEKITAEEPEVIEPEEEVTEEPAEEADPEETETITEPVTEEIPEEITEEEEPEVTEVPEEEAIPEETAPEETEETEETAEEEPAQPEPETVIEEELPEEPAAPEEIIEEETEEIPEVFEAADGDYTIGSYTYTVSNGTAYISSYNGTASSVTLPTSVTISGSSYKLTTLGEYAFSGNNYVKSVTIPAAYKKLEFCAFSNCANLAAVTINGNIVDCAEQSAQTGNGGANSNNRSVFYNSGTNTNGMTVTFGSAVTRVPAFLFATAYDISEDVYARVKTVNLSPSITSIGESAFERCYDLTTVNFTEATALQTIEDSAFCLTGLSKLSFANKLTSIGAYAFYGNDKLRTVTLHKNIKTVGEGAFSGCTALAAAAIKGNTTLRSFAFGNCTNLAIVKISGNIPDCAEQSVATGNWGTNSNNTSVFYNAGTNTDDMTVTFGSAVTRVPAYLFATGYDSSENVYAHVKTVNLSSSITSIGESAFERCYDLVTVNFTEAAALQTIEDSAFCLTGLTKLSFASKLTSIGAYAFYGNDKLRTVTLHKYIKTVNEGAFSGCTALAAAAIKGNTTLRSFAFGNCTNLAIVKISGNIPDCAEQSVATGNWGTNSNNTSVFYNAGTNTTGMTVTFGSGVTRVPAYLFATGYDYADKVYANVKKIVIPNSVKTIGEYAFYNCYDLASVSIKRNSITIGENSFGNDTKFKAAVYYNGPCHKQMKAYTSKFAYYAPLQPAISSLTATEEGIIVKWKAAVGAKTYYVYRKIGTGSYTKIAEVSKLQYFDKAAKTNGKKYTYKIKGVVGTKTGTASAGKAVTYDKTTALKKGWLQIGNDRYYVTSSYTYYKGWKTISGKKYYFASSGKMVTGLKTIGGKKYYFNSSGVMIKGWKKLSGKWYWFDTDGAMLASSSSYYNVSKEIDGKTYYFDNNGVCQNR
ncbi:MAG: leucine-rich repeat protein [Solobacterium sp.]|nr:leucine-rich repeat protein [Solobacterium sp.]